MARTKKGAKSPGYDYWSKRPTPDMSPGRPAKTMTHRLERIENKKIIKKELKDDE